MGILVMAKISKTTANKRELTRAIASSVRAHHAALEANLEQVLFDGSAPASLTIGEFVQAVVATLEASYEALELHDQEVASEVAQDRQKRARRDEIGSRLRKRLILLRTLIESDYGPAAARHLGLSGVTPDPPDQLVNFAQNVLHRLNDGLGDFEPLLPEITPQDITPRVAAIAQDLASLTAAIAAVDQDVRETQRSQDQRNQALARWTQNYAPIAGIIENLYRLARMPDHAERVRPTSRRRRASQPKSEDLPQDSTASSSDTENTTLDG